MPLVDKISSPAIARRNPELLAPAGDWECARAAVENGADAIYFGLEKFNARMRAHNFTEADLPALLNYLHRRGVKGYVTFNTLVFPNELADAETMLRAIIAAGVDAAIVQDVGICRLIRRLSPDFPIHASTQMTITSAAGVDFVRELGAQLVVLARECSLKEIEKIQDPGFASGSLPLEVFVHGALCVAYSGQCLTSEALGGRSANRGECAQACRMPYELISDGSTVSLGDRRYLLSPQDLAGLEVLPDLARLGVTSLKIEGRLKTPEYVANITRVYRRALDEIATDHDTVAEVNAESRYDLEMAFSRGLFTGWFRGIDNQQLVHARFGKKRGVFLGQVEKIEGQRVLITLAAPLQPGDGVVFDAGHPDQPEQGGRVYSVDPRGTQHILGFGHDDLDFQQIAVGQRLWKTSDPKLDRRLRQTFDSDRPRFLRPLSMEVSGRLGEPLRLVVRDEWGHSVTVDSQMPLDAATDHPLKEARLREQLGRLGGTAFRLEAMTFDVAGDVILPVSELNRMRRSAVAQIESKREKDVRWTLLPPTQPFTAIDAVVDVTPAATASAGPVMVPLVRSLAQLEAVISSGTELIYCDFDDPKNYRLAVETFRAQFGDRSHTTGGIFVAPPRIFKMGEEWILELVRSSQPDGYLMRNYDHLRFFRDARGVGDFSLNVANQLSAEYFKTRFGLERLCISYDLNVGQVEGLLATSPPAWFEITIHQHMPMFHMEHCVFCAFLSKGTDYTNCGRPCDKHSVQLRDRVGARHPLKADIGCRNTVFNARAQTGAEYLDRFVGLGVRYFRVEFVDETAQQVRETMASYGQLMRGEISGADLWRTLKLQSQLGVTRGTLERV